jgi:anti-sigma factor RsiW
VSAPPAVTCDTLLASISAFLDGDLGAATCAAIEAHAASCSRCGTVIADFREATGLCRKVADAPLPADVQHLARARVNTLLRK